MGIINNGILGALSGKTGPVVGGSWKGIDYLRAYVIPSNPDTADQRTQRSLFGKAVAVAKNLNIPILQLYWSANLIKKSAFNRFIQVNSQLMPLTSDFINLNMFAFDGTLPQVQINTNEYNETTGKLNLTWEKSTLPYPFLDSDKIIIYVCNKDNRFYSSLEVLLSAEAAEIALPMSLQIEELFVGVSGLKVINNKNYTSSCNFVNPTNA